MYNKIYSTYTDLCPRSGDRVTVQIEYFEIPMHGNPKYGYKKSDFQCPDSEDCPMFDKKHGCALYKKAPSQP